MRTSLVVIYKLVKYTFKDECCSTWYICYITEITNKYMCLWRQSITTDLLISIFYVSCDMKKRTWWDFVSGPSKTMWVWEDVMGNWFLNINEGNLHVSLLLFSSHSQLLSVIISSHINELVHIWDIIFHFKRFWLLLLVVMLFRKWNIMCYIQLN